MPEKTTVHPLVWIMAAVILGTLVQAAQAEFSGSWSGLLAVGVESPLRPLIEQELGPIALAEGRGHDGQATYAVALDPFLLDPPRELDAAYRYRRILLPILGSGLGTLEGWPLLRGLTSVNLGGFALCVVSIALIVRRYALPWWLPLAALANVGLYLSLQSTTPDVLALGLGLLAVAFSIRGQHVGSALLIAAAALAKETFVVMSLSLGAWAWFELRRSRLTAWYLASALPAVAWTILVGTRLSNGFDTGGNLGLPFVGLLESASRWAESSGRDIGFTAVALGLLVLAAISLFRAGPGLWGYLLVPWLLVALVSSHWIWDLGNNSLRTLAPLLPFSLFALFGSRGPSIKRLSAELGGVPLSQVGDSAGGLRH